MNASNHSLHLRVSATYEALDRLSRAPGGGLVIGIVIGHSTHAFRWTSSPVV